LRPESGRRPLPIALRSPLRSIRFAARGAARIRAGLYTIALLLVVSLPAAAATLASWNIRHLGHGEHKHYAALGEVVERAGFDFLAVQEAMTEEGVERLRSAIEAATGADWELLVSHDLGRGAYKERYAFLWNRSVVEYVDGAVVYLDITDRFAREPFSARFRLRDVGMTFVAATVHILHGRGVADRTPEIDALGAYWRWLEEIYPEDAARVLLMGDFNLAPHHPAWAALRTAAEPLIVDGATTLSSVDGRFANLYDNIWIPAAHELPIASSGTFEFPVRLGVTHEHARRHISDHAPVWVRLGAPSPERETLVSPVVGTIR